MTNSTNNIREGSKTEFPKDDLKQAITKINTETEILKASDIRNYKVSPIKKGIKDSTDPWFYDLDKILTNNAYILKRVVSREEAISYLNPYTLKDTFTHRMKALYFRVEEEQLKIEQDFSTVTYKQHAPMFYLRNPSYSTFDNDQSDEELINEFLKSGIKKILKNLRLAKREFIKSKEERGEAFNGYEFEIDWRYYLPSEMIYEQTFFDIPGIGVELHIDTLDVSVERLLEDLLTILNYGIDISRDEVDVNIHQLSNGTQTALVLSDPEASTSDVKTKFEKKIKGVLNSFSRSGHGNQIPFDTQTRYRLVDPKRPVYNATKW